MILRLELNPRERLGVPQRAELEPAQHAPHRRAPELLLLHRPRLVVLLRQHALVVRVVLVHRHAPAVPRAPQHRVLQPPYDALHRRRLRCGLPAGELLVM